MVIIECSVKGCLGSVHSRDLCNGHYHRLIRYGDPEFKPPIKNEYPEYTNWKAMKNRVYWPNSVQVPYYTGIKLYDEWHDFWRFLKDMGPKPGPEYQLDRIDNNGDYEPTNCRWVTILENNHNRQCVQKIERIRDQVIKDYKSGCLQKDLAKEYKVSNATISNILNKGR